MGPDRRRPRAAVEDEQHRPRWRRAGLALQIAEADQARRRPALTVGHDDLLDHCLIAQALAAEATRMEAGDAAQRRVDGAFKRRPWWWLGSARDLDSRHHQQRSTARHAPENRHDHGAPSTRRMKPEGLHAGGRSAPMLDEFCGSS
jgi:hypothetical protein